MLVACNNAHQYRRGWISPLIMRFSNRKSPPDYIRHDYREGVLIMLVDKETEERTNKCKGGKNIKVFPDRQLLRKHVDAG